MPTLQEAVDDFLAQRRIAVAGVSREGNLPANHILRKLRDAGYEAIPLNPSAGEVEGTTAYARLSDVPGTIDALVIGTPPEATEAVVEDAIALGIRRVWMHGGIGPGSVSDPAVERCREAGISVIPGACPMMFVPPVDPFHRCLRGFRKVTNRLPEPA